MKYFYKQISLTAISKFLGAAVGIIALVWWCVLYPELCFPRDTYAAVYETQENDVLEDEGKVLETEDESIMSESELSRSYPEILKANDEQIVIRSKLFEWIKKKTD